MVTIARFYLKHVIKDSKCRPPMAVRQTFEGLAKGKDYLNGIDFATFLLAQGEPNASEAHAKEIMARFPSKSTDIAEGMDIDAFLKFLLDPVSNSPLLQISNKPVQDMLAPLSHYYIYAGHNSYLTGNQLTSKSSVGPIADALQAGCRVIELDCWERKGRIQVLHGNTLTKPVPFEDCLIAIKENAFKATDYPVIITIENHLPPCFQKEAAKMVKEAFGDALYVPTAEERPPIEFASPENLRGKIIISDAPFTDSLQKQVADDPETTVAALPDILTLHEVREEPESPPLSPGHLRTFLKNEFTETLGAVASIAANTRKPPEESDKGLPQQEDLKELIYISCEKPNQMKESSVNGHLVSGQRAIMANLSEPELQKHLKRDPESIIEFTKNNLGRMYPFGLRFDSSNADPFLAWANGFQLAAINMQGHDRACWLCEAFFSMNGKCGYVKKPSIFLPNSEIDYRELEKMPPKLTLKVKALMGTDWHKLFDYFKKPDFYVKFVLHGIPIDNAKGKTKVAFSTMEPNWEDEEFTFHIRVPEISVLRIEVWEYDRTNSNDFVGQACYPVIGLRNGIHCVGLWSHKGVPQGSKILCSLQISEMST